MLQRVYAHVTDATRSFVPAATTGLDTVASISTADYLCLLRSHVRLRLAFSRQSRKKRERTNNNGNLDSFACVHRFFHVYVDVSETSFGQRGV